MQMQNLTIIFPLATALFALLWFFRWVRLRLKPIPEDAPALTPEPGFTKNDWLVLGSITVLYAIVGFLGLGSTQAPVSFLHYTDGNQYALIELNEPQ